MYIASRPSPAAPGLLSRSTDLPYDLLPSTHDPATFHFSDHRQSLLTVAHDGLQEALGKIEGSLGLALRRLLSDSDAFRARGKRCLSRSLIGARSGDLANQVKLPGNLAQAFWAFARGGIRGDRRFLGPRNQRVNRQNYEEVNCGRNKHKR